MRTESDSLGPVSGSGSALWGAQTQRAIENFAVSGLKQPAVYIAATALVKRAAARGEHGPGHARPVAGPGHRARPQAGSSRARWHDQFVVDPFQAGAGTSHNMNANEVIANLANEALGGARGVYRPVHPNDHVNMAQSTNDVIPTVLRVAASQRAQELLRVLDDLAVALEIKAD